MKTRSTSKQRTPSQKEKIVTVSPDKLSLPLKMEKVSKKQISEDQKKKVSSPSPKKSVRESAIEKLSAKLKKETKIADERDKERKSSSESLLLDFNEKKNLASTPKKIEEVGDNLGERLREMFPQDLKSIPEKGKSIKREVSESRSREKNKTRGRPKKSKLETIPDPIEDFEPEVVNSPKKGRKKVKKDPNH